MAAKASAFATKSTLYIPNLGTFHSQPGNVLFPTWEYGVPIMGNRLAASLVEEHKTTPNEIRHHCDGQGRHLRSPSNKDCLWWDFYRYSGGYAWKGA